MVEVELKQDQQQPGWRMAADTDPGNAHFHWRVSPHARAWRPPTDVYITETAILVRVEIAGMRDGEFTISLENNLLTIRGVRSDQPQPRGYHQMEIRFGEFRTDVELHWPVDTNRIEAEYHDGFLQLELPKVQPTQIHIQD